MPCAIVPRQLVEYPPANNLAGLAGMLTVSTPDRLRLSLLGILVRHGSVDDRRSEAVTIFVSFDPITVYRIVGTDYL